MATKLTSYKIFIASPGGLEDEREAFRNVINAYNSAEAIPRGAHFVPVGWEVTLRGVGRAQEKINDEVRQCDFFVLLLWDRWGTPTGSLKAHTSGTEEEYEVALEAFKDLKKSMSEIIVFFKAVTPRQLSDPGEQLRRVLDFKKKLESEKKLFFDTFDDKSSFQDKFRMYLGSWLRRHESGQTQKVTTPSLSAAESRTPIPDEFVAVNPKSHPRPQKGSSIAKKAKALAKAGKVTEAEALFTQAISRFDDPYAFNVYGEFLLDQHRWTQAEAMYQNLIKVSESAKLPTWVAFAYSKLSAIYLLLKDTGSAVASLQLALKSYEALSDAQKIAITAKRLGYLYLKSGQPEKSKPLAEKALEYFVANEMWREAGDTVAILARAAKKLEDEKAVCILLDKAIGFYEKGKEVGLVKNTISWRDHVKNGKPEAKEL